MCLQLSGRLNASWTNPTPMLAALLVEQAAAGLQHQVRGEEDQHGVVP